MTQLAQSPKSLSDGSIPINHHRWQALTRNEDPEFQLVSYGARPENRTRYKLVVRHKTNGAIFVAENALDFDWTIDWSPNGVTFTRLYVGVPHQVWETH